MLNTNYERIKENQVNEKMKLKLQKTFSKRLLKQEDEKNNKQEELHTNYCQYFVFAIRYLLTSPGNLYMRQCPLDKYRRITDIVIEKFQGVEDFDHFTGNTIYYKFNFYIRDL